jgi:hypothetical protein
MKGSMKWKENQGMMCIQSDWKRKKVVQWLIGASKLVPLMEEQMEEQMVLYRS